MKTIHAAVSIIIVGTPLIAHGQPAPQAVSPQQEAMTQTIIKLTGESLDWQIKYVEAKRLADELQRKADAQKVAPADPK